MPLAVLTTHFNPAGYRQKQRNFLRFLRQIGAEGVPIYVAEVSFSGQSWVLPDSINCLRFSVAADQVLWFKENLINLLERIVPAEFDKIAWIDADVWFQRLDWYSATEEALESHPVVQLCDAVIRTNEDGTIGSKSISAGKAGLLGSGRYFSGLAWAARRSLWSIAGGLYEHGIIGGGDAINAAAWLPDGGDLTWAGYNDLPHGIQRLKDWISEEGTCGCIEGTLWHEWHGDDSKRCWASRHTWLKDLDIQRDIQRREDGLIQWTHSAPPSIRKVIRDYFESRDEDGLAVEPSLRPWFDEKELQVISTRLRKSDVVLEFGAGGSTLWLAKQVKEVHTVEHDPSWANRIRSSASENVTVHLRKPNWPWRQWNAAEPGQFDNYLQVPKEIGGTWDVVIIDGRARIDAAIAVAPYVPAGGWLFFHDWFTRERYTARRAELEVWYELLAEDSVTNSIQSLAVFRRIDRFCCESR